MWRNKVARCKRVPDGWELLEPTLEEFEQTMREAGTLPLSHTVLPYVAVLILKFLLDQSYII